MTLNRDTTSSAERVQRSSAVPSGELDALIVGAGFAGLYALERLRGAGLSVKVVERASGVGGTWFHNTYPGARCDGDSVAYSYSFSEELQQEWSWTERYASQPEILRYLNHVADRFDLRRDIILGTRVISARYLDDDEKWEITTDSGDTVRSWFLIWAGGNLSIPKRPSFEGLDDFAGEWYLTADFPTSGVDFSDLRVGAVGTGSTGIQLIPRIAEQASSLTVFQRTANFAIPARNRSLSDEEVVAYKRDYPNYRARGKTSQFGTPRPPGERRIAISETPEHIVMDRLEAGWQAGGIARFLGSFTDVLRDPASNEIAADFVRGKIREIVKDRATADLLCPVGYPIGAKRLCAEDGYYETFNRSNVSLVSVKDNPIARVTHDGIRLADGTEYDLDLLVFAIGFDAGTGALLDVDIRGRGGLPLREAWRDGPMTLLGVQTVGFPNLMMITGPQSPSVLSTMTVSIEQHVEWVSDLISFMRERGIQKVEPRVETQREWVEHVSAEANSTLYPQAESWYLGTNVPGKPRVFLSYVGGVGTFRSICEAEARAGYGSLSFDGS